MQRMFALAGAVLWSCIGTFAEGEFSVASYSSIQQALDQNPNKVLFVPPGEYHISQRIRIRGEDSGLVGHGRIIQNNPGEPIIQVENARFPEIRDLTLSRPEGKMVTSSEAILVLGSSDLVVENVRILDNRTSSAALSLRESRNVRVSRCLIRNYMRVSVDDRTGSEEWGYAFNCTDGSGISVVDSVGVLVEGNRIVEENLLPTPEIKEKWKLGQWVKKNSQKGKLLSQAAWDAEYSENWQQGSGIIVTGPSVSDFTRILGNHVENAAQGIDIHGDHVIVANNVIVDSFIGMKAMHGSRNVLITGNHFVKNSLWAVGLMPGTASHPGEPGRPETANTDGGSVIANNIISDFGYGSARFVWGDNRAPFKFDRGQQPDDPALKEVVITGNLIHSTGEPRYRYAVVIERGGSSEPRDLRFSNNLFPPGAAGVANVDLKP